MPSEICGGASTRWVRCDAQVVRTGVGEKAELCAAQVLDYVFIDRSHRNADPGPPGRPPALRRLPLLADCHRAFLTIVFGRCPVRSPENFTRCRHLWRSRL